MPRELTAGAERARLALWHDKALLHCLEIERPVPAGQSATFFRLVRSARSLVIANKVWQAASFTVDGISEDQEGSLSQLRITIPNVSQIPLAYLLRERQPLGMPVRYYVAHEGDTQMVLSWEHVITSAAATWKAITLTCKHPGEAMRAPREKFTRDRFPGLLPQGGQSAAL